MRRPPRRPTYFWIFYVGVLHGLQLGIPVEFSKPCQLRSPRVPNLRAAFNDHLPSLPRREFEKRLKREKRIHGSRHGVHGWRPLRHGRRRRRRLAHIVGLPCRRRRRLTSYAQALQQIQIQILGKGQFNLKFKLALAPSHKMSHNGHSSGRATLTNLRRPRCPEDSPTVCKLTHSNIFTAAIKALIPSLKTLKN